MKKLRKIGRVKKDAWKWFSAYTRIKDSDSKGYTECVTCGERVKWSKCHAGHFLHGHTKPTFLIEENVHPQCVKCNHYLSGNLIEYTLFMTKKYGTEKIIDLKELSHKVIKFGRDYYESIIERYKKQFEEEVEKRKCRVSEE